MPNVGSESAAAAAAAAAPGDTATEATTAVAGAERIAAVLRSTGPVVKCVLLQHIRKTGRDVKPHPASTKLKADAAAMENAPLSEGEKTDVQPTSLQQLHFATHRKHREVLTELIQEIEVDTTPGSNGVQAALGGHFTFLGQYPDEGVMLMVRADQFADLWTIDSFSVNELQALCEDSPDIVNADHIVDKDDLIQAVKDAQLPLNPHTLQPPFDDISVRGDILLMKVAETPDEEGDDDPESAMAQAVKDFTSATAVPNEEFFLDYTMDEYIAFASRTDIVAPVREGKTEDESDDEDEYEEADETEGHGNEKDDNDDEDDEDYTGEDLMDEDEDKRLLLNLILGEVIKSFRKENGRGPDSEELLELRGQVAAKLGLQLPPPTPVTDSKRSSDSHSLQSPKRVKFTPNVETEADDEAKEDEDGKMTAASNGNDKDQRLIGNSQEGDDHGDSKSDTAI